MELNIKPTTKNGKRVWRYSYFGLDGKVKFISNKEMKLLKSLLPK